MECRPTPLRPAPWLTTNSANTIRGDHLTFRWSRITGVETRLDQTEKRLDERIIGVEARLYQMEKRLDDRITALEKRVDQGGGVRDGWG